MAEGYSAGAQVAQVIGEEAWAQLRGRFGGLEIAVPTRAGRKGEHAAVLRDVVGQAAFDAMVREAGGTKLYIPKDLRRSVRERNAAIMRTYLRMKADGSSSRSAVQRLSRGYDVTERHIYGIIRREQR